MGSTINLHHTTSFGREALTPDRVDATIRLYPGDGSDFSREFAAIHFQVGGDLVTIMVDLGQAHAIAAQIVSGLLACLPVVGDTEAA